MANQLPAQPAATCTVFVAFDQPDLEWCRVLIEAYQSERSDLCVLMTEDPDWLAAGRFKGPIALYRSPADAVGRQNGAMRRRWSQEILERWGADVVINLGPAEYDPNGEAYVLPEIA